MSTKISTMHNVFILGVPRSGTSLTASLFRDAGYNMGEELLPPTDSNPKGYFEDRVMNSLNNHIAREIGLVPRYFPLRTTAKLLRLVGMKPPAFDSRSWAHLAPRYPVSTKVSDSTIERMEDLLRKRPFCYKDPRLTYTLEVWMPILPEDTRFIVVFRSPKDTIRSMLNNSKMYSPPLPLTDSYCDRVYHQNYKHMLKSYANDNRFFFVRYEQILSGDALNMLRAFTGAHLDSGFADEGLSRSAKTSADITVSSESESVFEELVEVACAK